MPNMIDINGETWQGIMPSKPSHTNDEQILSVTFQNTSNAILLYRLDTNKPQDNDNAGWRVNTYAMVEGLEIPEGMNLYFKANTHKCLIALEFKVTQKEKEPEEEKQFLTEQE